MSQIEQVLAAARMLEEKGQEPSIALIKANLPTPLPLPVIVKGLQQFKNLSQDEKARLQAVQMPAKTTETPDELTALTLRVTELEALCQTLAARLERLEGSGN